MLEIMCGSGNKIEIVELDSCYLEMLVNMHLEK